MQNIQGKTRRQRVMERVLGDMLGDVLGVRAEDRLLPASILDFRSRLENRCKVFPVYALLRASILDFRLRLANRCSTIFVAVENSSPATDVAATRSASDSNFRCREGEWFSLQ